MSQPSQPKRAEDAVAAPEPRLGHSIIESLGVALPPKIVSTADILHGCKHPLTLPLERLTGIRQRRMAGDEEFSIDLARRAMAKCLAMSQYAAGDIDLLVCCNISRYDGRGQQHTFEPSTAVRLGKDFGCARALTFDIANGCAGTFTAITVVDALLKAGTIDIGMVVSGEYITHLIKTAQQEITHYTDSRLACLTLGDAGVAIIMTRAPNEEVGFHAIDLYTAGKYSHYCIGKPTDQEHGGIIMLTDSGKLHETAIAHSAAHMVRTLRQAQWGKDALDHVILHQTNQLAIYKAAWQVNEAAQETLCGDHNMIDNLAERGNTATTTHLVAVWDNMLGGRIRSGDNAVFAVQSSGLVIGTALYTFDDLPDRVRAAEAGGAMSPPVSSGPALVRHAARTGRRRMRIESIGLAPGDGEHLCRDGVEFVHTAMQRCLAYSSYRRDDVALLIHTGVYRRDFISEPAMAAMIAGRMQLNETGGGSDDARTLAFDISNGALGFLQACSVAAEMIDSRAYEPVMVVASEIENNTGLLGERLVGVAEMGSAVILDAAPDHTEGFGHFVFRTFPEYLEAFASWLVHREGQPRLHVESHGELEAAYLACIPGTVAELLELEGIRRQDVTVVLPPQLSQAFRSRLSSALSIGQERLIALTQEGHDPFTSTLACTFQEVRRCGLVRRGDIGLIVHVGSGVQVGCAIYYF